jgi:hypothetical protein
VARMEGSGTGGKIMRKVYLDAVITCQYTVLARCALTDSGRCPYIPGPQRDGGPRPRCEHRDQ